MYKNFYTTAMCPQRKAIEKRFKNIKSAKGIKKYISLIGTFSAAAILSTSVFASGVMQNAAYAADQIEVSYEDRRINFDSKPFIDNYEIYLPLREVLNGCGIDNDSISYNNGSIDINLYSQSAQIDVKANIKIGDNGITFDIDADNYMVNGYTGGKRPTSHPTILKDGVTYAPAGAFIRIKDLSLDSDRENQYSDEDFRYSRAIQYNLLEGLEIRKYDENGKYNAVISKKISIDGDDKYNPKSYYNDDENVFIGTPVEQNGFMPEYNSINGYYFPKEEPVKRIVVDEEGKVIAVIPPHNQKYETLSRLDMDTFGGVGNGFPEKKRGMGLITKDNKTKITALSVGVTLNGRVEPCFFIPAYLMVQPY